MESNKSGDSVDNDVQKTDRSRGREDSAAEEKKKLIQQISELKSMISQIKSSLGGIKFGDVIRSNDVINSKVSDASCIKDISDVNAKLQNEFYRLSGIYCTKFSGKEAIFHLKPSGKDDKQNCFAVQILFEKGKATLGKWVLPMSVDIDQLLLEYPLTNVPNFVNACKQHVDSYYERLQQFQAFRSATSGIKNCRLQVNLGYTQFTLSLMRVHITKMDCYANINIYFLYRETEVMVFKIVVESEEEKIPKLTIKEMKRILMKLRALGPCVVFEMLSTKNNDIFTWEKEVDIESPVELDAQIISEDGFLDNMDFLLEESHTIRRRRKQANRRYKKKKQQNVSKTQNSLHDNQKSMTLLESRETQPLHSKTFSSTNNSINRTATSDANTPNSVKLKQLKLNFTVEKIKESHKNKNAPSLPSVHAKRKKR